jgi:TolA-binding protein
MRWHEMGVAWTLVGSVLLGAGWIGKARGDDGPAKPEEPGRKAVARVAPDLPRDIVLDLQAGKYLEAEAALAGLKPDEGKAWTDDDRDYLALVRSIALRLGEKREEGLALAEATLKARPEGRWAAKLKGELVANHLAGGEYAKAESIARVEAERLLAGDRKDRLAAVYEEFARRLLDPAEPTTPADPEGAYALLAQARELAKGADVRARLLIAMGRASQKAGNPARAIENYQLYLKENPKGAEADAARFALGEAQLATGQVLPARLTWADLARDLEKRDTKAGQELRGRAMFQISRTYGLPAPGDDTSLNLGIASLRRLLDAYPDHALSVQAAYDIAEANAARGKSEAALAAFRAFLGGEGYKASTDAARTLEAQLVMAAQFRVGQILQGQGRFAEAIEAWRTYLAKHPNGPQSADAQRAVVDTQLLIAQEHFQRKEYDKARAAWDLFVAQNPLDARVPQALYGVGESYQAEKKYDEAIKAWELLSGKFPGSEPAAHGEFSIASIYEVEKGEPTVAIERFRKIAVEPWASQARQRIAVMEAKALAVVTPRAFRSGETATLKITTRNLETLTFTAYRLDVEAYFRKKNCTSNVEALDIGLVQPDAEWTAAVPGYDKYKPIETEYELPKLEIPGVYVVKVTDEKSLQATTLVIGSDVDAIVKASRDQLLVFVQDMKTGAGRAGARVLVSDGQNVILDAKTGADGVLLTDWKDPRNPGQGLTYIVMADGHAAGSGLSVPGQVAQGLSPRAYLYTDRPAYRPGQTVELRGVVREVEKGQYDPRGGSEYRLEVYDTRGRTIVARPVTLSEFGTFHASVEVDSGAPLGTYQVRLFQPGKSTFSGSFEVQAYQLQKIDLTVDLPRTVYFRGETVEGKVVARYQYGTPLAGRDIAVSLPDGRTITGRTDEAGEFAVSFSTEGFAEEQALPIVAQLPQDGVAATGMAQLAIRAFRIGISTAREVYLDGESFPVELRTTDALGEPTGQALTLSVLKQVEQAGRTAEREVRQVKLQTDAKTGKASVPVKVDDEKGGTYILRVAGTDRFANPIVEDRRLTISGEEDGQKLRFLADRLDYKVGETASIALHSRLEKGTALLTWEADRILTYKLVPLAEGANAVKWDVEAVQFPNFTLSAARMAGTRLHQAQLNLRIVRELKVELKPRKGNVGPGEEVVVDVTTVDQLGRPVSAELSLALIDRALLRLYGDRVPPIGPFFYDQTRTIAFATESTIAFAYRPPTVPVAEAVVEEMEQAAALALGAQVRADVLAEMPAASAPMAAPARGMIANEASSRWEAQQAQSGGMGPMGGGMGGMMAGRPGMPADAPAGSEFFAYDAEEKDARLEGGDRAKLDVLAKRRAGAAGLAFRDAKSETATPRQQFVETAYWNPAVKTGPDGRGTVTFTAPTALSDYQFTARGVTGSDTLVGQATARLSVNQDFFVDVRTPSALTEGDAIRFPVELHHRNVKGTAEVVLTLYAGGREQRYPRTVELKGDGVETLLFEAYSVPPGEFVRLTVEARAGDARDKVTTQVPIRPWGVTAIAGASGTASDDATVFVALPEGRPYESPEMVIALSPSLRRLIVEVALGQQFHPLPARLMERCIWPPVPDTVADRASEAMGLAAALSYLRAVGGSEGPDAARLVDRLRSAASELVTLQNDDGGWPWVPGSHDRVVGSDHAASAIAFWALAEAEKLGLVPDPAALERGTNYLTMVFPQVDAGNQDARAFVLHALSVRGKASFEWANALNRERQGLSDAALAYLALTFGNLNRASLGAEVLDVLGPRAKSETPRPGDRPLVYWDGRGRNPHVATATEATALAALAYARVRPNDEKLEAAIRWLDAHRTGLGWQPHKAKGPALAALASYHGRARAAEDRYRLVVTVNDQEVHRIDVQGAAEGAVITVPIEKIKAGGPNRVHFDLEGRGTYGYAVTLTGFTRDFGPDQVADQKPFGIHRRAYWAPEPTLDGRPLPVGFGVAINPQTYENVSTQIAPGTRIGISVEAWRNQPAGQPAWERDEVVLEEYLPAGTSLVEGSVVSQASRYEVRDGVLRLYFAPDQWPGVRYEVFGRLTGQYRALPPAIRSLSEPTRLHLGQPGDLAVLAPGEKSADPERPTPHELYARGKALFDRGDLAEAGKALEALWSGYTLRDDVARDAARMLLTANIKDYNARKVVQYFEVLKEKAPDLVVSFDDIKIVGRAYADLGENERAWLVWRATTEASYLEDARVGEVLRQRGQTLNGLSFLVDLWREHPGSAAIQNDLFGLASAYNDLAARAIPDPAVRRELGKAGVTRPELLAQQVRLIQAFLALSPSDPVADEASLAEVGAFLQLEDYPRVVKLAGRLASIYPKSSFLDSFLYSQALAHFHLGEYDPAIGLAERIATATYKDATGVDQPSPNKWEAVYILGQIHDARHEPAKALSYYRQVADRFGDAAGAIKELTRKALALPEVAVVRPKSDAEKPAVTGVGLRSVDVQEPSAAKPAIQIDYRNLAEVDLKVYAVDLMRLYLTRRNLDGITGIDLAGIRPLVERTVALGDGEDYMDKVKELDLPLEKEGAYLVMARGESLYASGIVLVSPIELEVLEESPEGRVRVRVLDARSRAFLPKVQVKVIGSNMSRFVSGETDLRGVFVAEGISGTVTAVARKGTAQYAFYRGKTAIGAPAAPPAPTQAPGAPGDPNAAYFGQTPALDQNVQMLNRSNSLKQMERLQQRYNMPAEAGKGVQVDKAR